MKTKMLYEALYSQEVPDDIEEARVIERLFRPHTEEVKKLTSQKSFRKKISSFFWFRANGKVELVKLLWVKLRIAYSTCVLHENVDDYLDRVDPQRSFLDFVEERGEMEKLLELAEKLSLN